MSADCSTPKHHAWRRLHVFRVTCMSADCRTPKHHAISWRIDLLLTISSHSYWVINLAKTSSYISLSNAFLQTALHLLYKGPEMDILSSVTRQLKFMQLSNCTVLDNVYPRPIA
jgi:hypothetical protein